MMAAARFRRSLLPSCVFVLVLAAHFAMLAMFPEQNPAQLRWAIVAASHTTVLERYMEAQEYWLGFSYALSLAFAVVALRRYREERLCTARTVALGGVTFSGFLGVAGCYLIGCCGSPMLAVYLSLFGAAFVPLAKPMVAAATIFFVGTAWWWMSRRASIRAIGACSGVQCPPAR